MNDDDLIRRGTLIGLAFGLAAGALVLALPNPSNIKALRLLGTPFLYYIPLLERVPGVAVLYFIVVPVQWTLFGWVAARLLVHWRDARRRFHRPRS